MQLPPGVVAVAPICRYFGTCGGCAAQHMPAARYAEWKRGAVVAALAGAGVEAPVGALVDAHGEGRRRATFHARARADGGVECGFMRARAHEIVVIDACPLLAPELSEAPKIAHALAVALKGLDKPLDIQTTATLNGVDVDIRGCGRLGAAETRKVLAAAELFDLARLSNHGVALIERRPAAIAFGEVRVVAPAGGFLQATALGEATLAELARAALAGAGRVADLFCGAGAFALRLAADHPVFAADNDAAAIAALRRAAADAPGLRNIEATARDLFVNPVPAAELSRCEAVLFDPPRAGAQAQTREIAASSVTRVVAISCNVETFARDARALIAAGFVCDGVTPIDQFRYSPHVEIFAAFQRAKPKRRRSILG
ncbi:MAG: class I SAM-dependent RNA methyltransferase [Pseudomonadota bacterium]|nr:class I SAM-dependent RNA methyltransferase [Pseudomonadota bacterium]